MKVSVIVPVYNVQKYLRQCVDSIIYQSYKDLEIILVDDGSTDSSGNICEEYAALDNRVSVIHKPNGGLMSAWKAGFLASTSPYIGFVDSDDWIDDNMYEELVRNAIFHEADVVICQLIKEVNECTHLKEKLRLDPGVYNKERIRDAIIPEVVSDGTYLGRKISPNRVTKLFKRRLLEDNVKFCDDCISLGEDLITTFSCIFDANKIVVLSEFYPYHYRMNNQSITGKYDEARIKKVELLNSKLKEISIQKKIDISVQVANDYISLALLCIEIEILYAPFSRLLIIDKIHKIYTDNIFKQSLQNGNTGGFSLKYKLYLFLLRYGKYEVLYTIRRIISAIKQSK